MNLVRQHHERTGGSRFHATLKLWMLDFLPAAFNVAFTQSTICLSVILAFDFDNPFYRKCNDLTKIIKKNENVKSPLHKIYLQDVYGVSPHELPNYCKSQALDSIVDVFAADA